MLDLGPDKTFDLLLDALKEAHSDLFGIGFKISGAALIVLGWFATKPNPLSFLCSDAWLVYGALGGVGGGFLLICYLFFSIKHRADTAHGELVRREYDVALFQHYRISGLALTAGLSNQAMILGGIIVYIYYKYELVAATTCQ